MLSEKRRNELKKLVATYIIKTPFSEEREWYDLYNEFVTCGKYVEQDFGAVCNLEFEEISFEVMNMIKDAQNKKYKVI